jgi:metal-responsive CopG/Arc/MetJ family transcriptional regulator
MSDLIPEDDENLFGDLKEDKVRVTITIDNSLFNELDKYKKDNGIKELSPMLNIILKDWIKKKKGKKK